MTQSFSSRIYLVSHHSGRFDKILSKNIFLLIKSKKYVTIKWCKPNMISILCISYKVSLWGTIKTIRTLESFVIQRSALIFRGWQPNFQEWLQNFKVAASKFNIHHPLTSMATKMARKNFEKNPQINANLPNIDGSYEF